MLVQSLKKVFGQPKYIVGAISAFIILFFSSILFPNFSLIGEVWKHFGLRKAVELILGLVFSADASLPLISIVSIFVISFLFAINLCLLVFYVIRQKNQLSKTDVSSSTLGLILGIIGIGCASCGSLIVISILSFFGASGALAFLPLHGQEFGLIGIIVLIFSNYWVLKKISSPQIC